MSEKYPRKKWPSEIEPTTPTPPKSVEDLLNTCKEPVNTLHVPPPKAEQWEIEFDAKWPHQEGLYNTQSGWLIKADPVILKLFIKRILSTHTQELRKLIEGMLVKPTEIEEKHQAQFARDERRYRANPTEANLAVMKIHEGSLAQYFGGRNQGYIQALTDLLTALPLLDNKEI